MQAVDILYFLTGDYSWMLCFPSDLAVFLSYLLEFTFNQNAILKFVVRAPMDLPEFFGDF